MPHYLRGSATALLMALLTASLAACGSLSHNVAEDGNSAEELVWPDIDDTTPLNKGGTTPTFENLRYLHPGMEKNQVADLIGYPHFSEGRWKVREWDYLFTFRTPEGLQQCQFKVLFDTDYLAQSYYWHPEACRDLVWPKKTETFQLAADTLFDFDSATVSDRGHSELDELVNKVKEYQDSIDRIRIIGYTDSMGPDGYNRLLSQQRAFAVLSYLESQGIPAKLMTAIGMGKSNPVKTDCDVDAEREERIACMAPNRRVEVEVDSR